MLHEPDDRPANLIFGLRMRRFHLQISYQVIICEVLNEVPSGETAVIMENATYVEDNTTSYRYQGRPNRKYRTGVEAQTCAGYGKTNWSDGSCITAPGGKSLCSLFLVLGAIHHTIYSPNVNMTRWADVKINRKSYSKK